MAPEEYQKKEGNKRHYPVLVIDKTKGYRSVTQSSILDKELCYQVDYNNRQLKLLNKKYTAPRFSQEQIISNKPKKNKTSVRYRKNYKLLSDGIHPNRTQANYGYTKWWSSHYRCLRLVNRRRCY